MTAKPLTQDQLTLLRFLRDKGWVLLMALECFSLVGEDAVVLVPALVEDGLLLFRSADEVRHRGGAVRISPAGLFRWQAEGKKF